MKKYLHASLAILVLVLLQAHTANAQQESQYTQYVFNQMLLNPGYAGSKGRLNANLLARVQWVGIEGRPATQTFAIDGSDKRERKAWGAVLTNDEFGAQRQTGMYANFAYRINLSEQTKLSFGAAAGAVQYSIDKDKLIAREPGDQTLMTSANTKILPDFKVGFYLYNEKYFAGISTTGIGRLSTDDFHVRQQRHYYLTAGTIFNLSQDFKFKPTLLWKEDLAAPSVLDVNAFLLYQEKLWLGLAWRATVKTFGDIPEETADIRNAAAIILQYHFLENWRAGYSYDLTVSGLKGYSTHEVMIGYTLPHTFLKSNQMVNPRYF